MATFNNENFRAAVMLDAAQAHREIDKVKKKIEELQQKKEQLQQKQLTVGLDDKELKSLQRVTDRLRDQEAALSRVRAAGKEVYNTLQNLDSASPRELKRTLRELERTMESGKVKRGSDDWELYRQKAAEVRAALQEVQQQMRTTEEQTESLTESTETLTNAWNVAQQVKDWAAQYVNEYAAISDELTGVAKYTGMAEEEVQALFDDLQKIDTRTSHEALLQLAQDAGRLGLQSRQDVLQFVEAADTINLALGEDLGEDAVRSMAKLAQIFGDADAVGLKQAMLATASTINVLAQSSTASEPYLAEFAARLGSIGSTAGLTQAQILALGSVMDQSGVNVERAATALQNVLMKLYQDPAAAAKAAGLDVQTFTNLIRTDANEALLRWAQAMGNLQGGISDTAPALKSLHMAGSGVSEMVLNLSRNTDLVRTTQQQAAQAFRDATSATNEAAQANSSAAARLEILEKRAAAARIELGQKLFPAYAAVVQGANAITSIALNPYFLTAAAAVGVYTAAVNAAVIADKLKVFWQNNVLASLKRLYVVMLANPWAAVAAAVTAVVGVLISLRARTEEATDSTRRLAAAQYEGEKSAAAETARLRVLYDATQDQTLAMADRLAAADELIRQYPEYFGKLSREAILTGAAADAYADLTQQIIASAQARAMEAEIEKIAQQNIDLKRKRDEAQRLQDTYDQARQSFRHNATVGMGMGFNGQSGWNTQQFTYTIQDLDRQIAANNNAINALAQSINQHRAATQQAAQRAQQASADIATGAGSGGGGRRTTGGERSGSGGGSTRTTAETPQQGANRERQERLENITSQLASQELSPLARTILTAWQRVLQEEISAGLPAATAEERRRADEHAQMQQRAERQTYNLQQAEAALAQQRQQQAQSLLASLRQPSAQAAATLATGGSSATQTAAPLATSATLAQSLALSDSAAATLAENVSNLSRDLAEGIVSADGFNAAISELYRQAANDTALATLRQRLQDIDQAQRAGLITQQQAIILARQAKQQRQQTVRELTDKDRWQPTTPQSQTGSDIATIAQALRARQELFRQIAALEEQGVITHEEAERRRAEATRQYGQTALAVAQAVYNQTTQLASAYSSYLNAARDQEVAAVTAAYDRQIAAQKSGSKKARQLEEKKQKEIAKIKNKYNRRAQAIEVAQALAATALAAVNAYAHAAKLGGPVAGAIAAAIATAAGMLQVATIQKQHEAQAEGYASGGFTPPGPRLRPAGTVHAGEFVAAQEAVSNPAVRPVLELIDQAQRSGAATRIAPHDIIAAAATAAPVATQTATATAAALAPQRRAEAATTTQTSAALTDAITTLNQRLADGTLATVALDGPDGLARQYARYQRLRKR